MRFADLLAFLKNLEIRPSRRLSQNFLIDQNIIRKLLDLAELQQNEHVFEIGPGLGAITEAILARGATVTWVEKDRRLAGHLGGEQGDILTFDLDKLPRCKVISNLPFHLTSPILERLLPRRDLFVSLTLIVQKELGDRICAKPGQRAYGSFSIFVQFYAEVHYGFAISASCFYPKPAVMAAAISLIPKEPPAVDPVQFFQVVHKAFAGRRKMISTTLGKERVLRAGLDPTARPETLSLQDFLKLSPCGGGTAR